MPNATMIERHIAASKDRPGECWPYPGYCNRRTGYGNAYWQGVRWEAHRAAYTMLVGPIPEGMHIDHLCRNRPCCNPSHMEPVPPRVNLLRGDSPRAKQARQTHCKQGHPLVDGNLRHTGRDKRECVMCFREKSRARYYARTGDREVPPLGKSGRRQTYHLPASPNDAVNVAPGD